MSDTVLANGSTHAVQPLEASCRSATGSPGPSSIDRSAKKRRGMEPYDALLWRLQSRAGAETTAATVGLIGCEPRAGVTTLAANLAVRASELRLGPVLLVEADADRPRLASSWKLASGPGLAELLSGEALLSECVRHGPADDLHVIAASGSRGNLSAWDPGAVDALLTQLRSDYRLVLFDLPPADKLHHAALLARRLDQVLLVVRSEYSRGPLAQRMADQLLADGVPLAGVVLNRQRAYVPRWLSCWI